MVATTSSKRPFLQYLELAVLLIFAACLRFYHLGTESLWFDEAISFRRSSYAVQELVTESIQAYHNPTYFLLLRAFRGLGDSEFALRLPSAIFGIGKVWLTYTLATKILGHRGGLVAAAFIALSRYQIHYDQEARMYAPLLFFTTLALNGLIVLVERSDEVPKFYQCVRLRSSDLTRQPSPIAASLARAWALFIVGTIAALYLHNTAVIFVAATWCAVGVTLFKPKQCPGFFQGWIIANAIVLISFAPWIPTLFKQTENLNVRSEGKAFPSLTNTFNVLSDVYLGGLKSPLVTIPVLILCIFGAWHLRNNKKILFFLLTLCVSTPLLFLLVSLKHPMFLTRMLLWVAIPFSILVAAGLNAIPGRFRAGTLCLCLGLLFAFHLQKDYFGRLQKPDWKGAISALSKSASDDSIVLAVGDREWRLFYYYFNRENRPFREFLVHFDVAEMQTDLPKFLEGRNTVWTVRTRDYPTGKAVREKLMKLGNRVFSRKYGPRLVVEKYTLNRTECPTCAGSEESLYLDEP